MKRIVIVNGPNLSLLGKREPHVYGTRSHAELVKSVRAKARELGVTVSVFQSNDEGAIIDYLQKEAPGALGIVINPAALSHYSLALFDCLQALDVPTVEVHISNIHAREEFRSKSVTARAARGVITGLGFAGYGLAMEYLAGSAKELISTSDFRNGTMFEMDGQLLQVVNVEHIKLARAGAVIKAKLRNLMTGSMFEHSFRSGDKYKTVRIDKNEATYLYSDGSHHYFMDTQTYDQVPVDEELLESALPLLKEGSVAYLLRYQDRLIGVELPINVELKVVSTDPGFRGDTVSGGTKPAKLETGATIQVPLFIQPGDVIRVDTRTQSYMERA